MLLSYIVPSWFDSVVPAGRRAEGDAPTVPLLASTVVEAQQDDQMENGNRTNDEVVDESKKADEVDSDRFSDGQTPQRVCDKSVAPF